MGQAVKLERVSFSSNIYDVKFNKSVFHAASNGRSAKQALLGASKRRSSSKRVSFSGGELVDRNRIGVKKVGLGRSRPVLERKSKTAAIKWLRAVTQYLLADSKHRPTRVVSRVVKDTVEEHRDGSGTTTSFKIENDVLGPRGAVSWRIEKEHLCEPGGTGVKREVERQTHTVTGLTVNRQSAFDDFKHVAAGCEGVASRLDGLSGYVSASKDPRAASTAHLNMAHLVPGSRFLIPKHELTTVFTSPGYNQVTMVAEEKKLYKWLGDHNVTEVDCAIELDLVPADPGSPDFKKIVKDEMMSVKDEEGASAIGENALAYTRAVAKPVLRSYRAVYTDKRSSKEFVVHTGVDATFPLSRRHVKPGSEGVTPAASRYAVGVGKGSVLKAFGKVDPDSPLRFRRPNYRSGSPMKFPGFSGASA